MSTWSEGTGTAAPPPPPPLPILPGAFVVAGDRGVDETRDGVVSLISKLYSRLVPGSDCLPDRFHYTHMKSLIQDGPTCGLVALCMITTLTSISCTLDTLLGLAKQRGYTKRGEMFSTSNMFKLAQEVLSRCFLISHFTGGIMRRREVLVEELLAGDLCLIPYDADKNHSPANLNGLKAHWAVLCGAAVNSGDCLVLARQSKSRHVALWHFDRLHDSNMNLSTIAIDKSNSNDYVIDDIKNSLAGNFIVFHRK